MTNRTLSVPASKKMMWTGRILSAVPVLLLTFGACMAFVKPPMVVQQFAHFGYPESAILGIGIAELGCALLYVFPRTSVLGAILMTAYLGGATATHVRIGEPPFLPILVAVSAWGGLYLREERLRALVPFRS